MSKRKITSYEFYDASNTPKSEIPKVNIVYKKPGHPGAKVYEVRFKGECWQVNSAPKLDALLNILKPPVEVDYEIDYENWEYY